MSSITMLEGNKLGLRRQWHSQHIMACKAAHGLILVKTIGPTRIREKNSHEKIGKHDFKHGTRAA